MMGVFMGQNVHGLPVIQGVANSYHAFRPVALHFIAVVLAQYLVRNKPHADLAPCGQRLFEPSIVGVERRSSHIMDPQSRPMLEVDLYRPPRFSKAIEACS